jgi:hypothetical protein
MKHQRADEISTLRYFITCIGHQIGYYSHNQTKDNKTEMAWWISRGEEKKIKKYS